MYEYSVEYGIESEKRLLDLLGYTYKPDDFNSCIIFDDKDNEVGYIHVEADPYHQKRPFLHMHIDSDTVFTLQLCSTQGSPQYRFEPVSEEYVHTVLEEYKQNWPYLFYE